MIFKKKISQDLIDNNHHLNISSYIKLVDESNKIMLKILKQNNYYFVAKKIFMENNKFNNNEFCCKRKGLNR